MCVCMRVCAHMCVYSRVIGRLKILMFYVGNWLCGVSWDLAYYVKFLWRACACMTLLVSTVPRLLKKELGLQDRD